MWRQAVAILIMHSFSSAQAHQKALASLDETNKKRVQNASGEYVTTMGFDEAFAHHLDYVYCRAKGIFGASIGSSLHASKT